MAKAIAFDDLLQRAREGGIDPETISIAEKLEAKKPGLGATVLLSEVKELKVDHIVGFLNVHSDAASAFYQAWINFYEAAQEYGGTHNVTVDLNYPQLKMGVKALDSKDNPLTKLIKVTNRRRSADSTSDGDGDGGPQTTDADVIALGQYIKSVTKQEPTVYMNLDGGLVRVTGTLNDAGEVVADKRDGDDKSGKIYPTFRDWKSAYYGSAGGSPTKLVGIITEDGNEYSLEKAVRLARDAGNISADNEPVLTTVVASNGAAADDTPKPKRKR